MVNRPVYPEVSEAKRFPMLSERGRRLLHQMRQHQYAPLWNWPNGEQLNEAGLNKVQAFANSLKVDGGHRFDEVPDWLDPFVDRCLREVPYYRKHYHGLYRGRTAFEELPATCRADLAPRVWEFVPDSEPLDEVIVFSSSGTTGYPTRTAHHPASAACGVPLLEFALESLHGLRFPRGPETVAICNVAAYRGAFTTAIVVAYLQEAGCIRVNLDASAWRSVDHCAKYINQWKAPIWLGDPVAFGALEKIELDHKPQAILSSIMHLTDGYAKHLEQRYACPVIDLYAMTEAGIVAARTPEGHRILPNDLHVEILDPQGKVCQEGVRGEVTLTGGRNPYLPLLRYRTHDYASLRIIAGHRVLVDLQGRSPVEYKTRAGRIVHSMEVTHVMRRYAVLRYEVTESSPGEFTLLYSGDIDKDLLDTELEQVFGQQVMLAKTE